MRKIRRVHRKIEDREEGGLSLYISRILLFLKRNNGKRDYVIHLWNKINLFFLYEYSPCVKRNILRVVLALRNNPEQGKHTSRRMYLHYFHYNGAELCAPRYWWLFIHVITLERIKKSFNVEKDPLQISFLNLYIYKMLRFRWFIDTSPDDIEQFCFTFTFSSHFF